MQDVFEKIIEKLNSKKTYFQGFYEREGKTEHDSDLNKATQLALDDAIEIVKQEDTEYNNGWIPCSERLPEKNQLVLVCAESTTISSGTIRMVGAYANGAWFIQNSVDTLGFPCLEYCVVAWQPLPLPYQPKGENNENS